jgi:hypothetical protein
VRVSEATPSGTVVVLASAAPGSSTASSMACGALPVDLAAPLSVPLSLTAGASGSAVSPTTLSAAACGRAVQAVDVSTCTTSEVAFIGAVDCSVSDAVFVSTTGVATDRSADLAAGLVSIPSDGTLWVCPGTYQSSIDVTGGDVAIRGLGSAEIVAPPNQRLIETTGIDLRVWNLTLTGNGVVTGSGGAVNATGTTVSMERVSLSGFTATGDGGCVNIDGGILNLKDSDLTSCAATGIGGGVYIENHTYPIVDTSVIEGTILAYNSAGYGGALGAYGSLVTVEGSDLHDNLAGRGGAIFTGFEAEVTVVDSDVVFNDATYMGGGFGGGGGGAWVDLYDFFLPGYLYSVNSFWASNTPCDIAWYGWFDCRNYGAVVSF